MLHPALPPGNVAVVTGAASGIGFAAARRFAAMGLKLVLADLPSARLEAAADAVTRAGGEILAVPTDVSSRDDLRRLEAAALDRFGPIHVLMNNAGIQPGSSLFDGAAVWEQVLAVNLWGPIHGVQVFVPGMIAHGQPGLVINTGSKQGITTPPGDPAYNVSKAGVKVLTEALAHELRSVPGCRITAHLLIPGFVFTALTARGRAESPPPPGRPSRPSTSCSSPWAAATSTSSVPTTTCRADSTSGASCGPPTTSSTTARPCRAGTPTGRSGSRRGLRKAERKLRCPIRTWRRSFG